MYICKLTITKFDWNAVGKNLGLKSGTASMRWRRLKDKIQVSDLPEVGVLAIASTPTSSRPVAQTAAIAAPAAASVAPKIPPKRKRDRLSVDDNSEISIDERLAKKIKHEDNGVTKRQTRGRVLNLRDPVDSSSSVTGASVITTESSFYEPSATKEEDEDDYIRDIGAGKPGKPKTKTLPNVQSQAVEQKTTSKQQHWNPSSVYKPLEEPIGKPKTPSKNIEATLGFNPWAGGMSRTPPPPKPISPLSAKTLHSLNEDHEQVKADIAGFRAQTTSYTPPFTSMQSAEHDSESAAAGSSAVCTSAIGTHDSYRSREEASVSPADSISVVQVQGPTGEVDMTMIDEKKKEKSKSERNFS